MLIPLALLLTACYPNALTPSYAAPTYPAPAIVALRANGQVTETAIAIDNAQRASEQTQAAYTQAAAAMRATQAAGDATETQAAVLAMDAQATAVAITTARARQASDSETAIAHTTAVHIAEVATAVKAQQVSDSLTATATAEVAAAQRRADDAEFYAFVRRLFVVACALVILAALIFIAGATANRIEAEQVGKADAERISAKGEAEADRIFAESKGWSEAMRARVFAHGGSLVWVGDDGQPVVLLERKAEAPEAAPQLEAHSAQPPMINSAANSYPLVASDRQDLVAFLFRAMRRAGQYAETIDTIPSHKTMGIGAEGWSAHVQTLSAMGFVEVVPNKGTFIRGGYRTLKDLADAVKNGAGIIPPTPSTPSESGEPFSGNGWNGENGGNTLRSRTEVERPRSRM